MSTSNFIFFFCVLEFLSLFSFPSGLGGRCQDLICYLQFCWMDSELPHGDITSLQASKRLGTVLLFEHFPPLKETQIWLTREDRLSCRNRVTEMVKGFITCIIIYNYTYGFLHVVYFLSPNNDKSKKKKKMHMGVSPLVVHALIHVSCLQASLEGFNSCKVVLLYSSHSTS